MIAAINWSGPMTPPPDWAFNQSLDLDWDAANSWYHGISPPAQDQVEVWFILDLITGAYTVYMEAIRDGGVFEAISSNPASTPPGELINVTIDEWIGIWFDHTCTATFTT
jgi:hypothetical protein